MQKFFEVGDVAREVGLSCAMVRHDVATGKLVQAATTLRGLRLFRADEVERYKAARIARADMLAAGAA